MLAEQEAEARWLLRDFDAPPGARALVEHHLGHGAVLVVRGMAGREAELITLRGRPTICVRARLSPVALRWALLHELAEWHLQRIAYREPDVEHMANAIAAALAAPRDAFLRAVRDAQDDFAALAELFSTTQTCAALRLGEVTGQPIAVIAPALVRVRGDDWAWPDERALRRYAREACPWRRRPITDARRRAAILAPTDSY